MARSTTVALLLIIFPIIFPSYSLAQEVGLARQVTHEVVRGETLWALAGRYLGNPFRWPLIHEANADQIQNPHLIKPGQIFVIPEIGQEATQVREVMVVAPGEIPTDREDAFAAERGGWVQASGGNPVLCPDLEDRTVFYSGQDGSRSCGPTMMPSGQRTAFYSDLPASDVEVGSGSLRVSRGMDAPVGGLRRFAVPFGLVYSSEWLEPTAGEGSSIGTLVGFSHVFAEGASLGPASGWERVLISTRPGEGLRVGDLLQTYRTIRKDRKLGETQGPTGVLVVNGVTDDGILAMVSSQFDRIRVGDLVRHAPDYSPRAGIFPTPVESDVLGTILGFPKERGVQGLGANVFLDIGEDQGITIGDIFLARVEEPGLLAGMESARLQVVSVEGDRSTLRIISVTHPGLGAGDRVRLVARIQ